MLLFKRLDSEVVQDAIQTCDFCRLVYNELIGRNEKYVVLTSRYGHLACGIEDLTGCD